MSKRIHIIGIGGTGMSAIAKLLHETGYQISGSDRTLSPLAADLRAMGIPVHIGHRAENVGQVDLVLRSSAVPDTNVEVEAAFANHIPVEKRADFLGQFMADRIGVAIAGTHGKTTTTSMIAWMLSDLGQDPAFIVGGTVANLGTNAKAGNGPFVIEADEYDRMFLGLCPKIAVITNMEHDHPDCFPTPESFEQAFLAFIELLPKTGTLLICGDDQGARGVLAQSNSLEFASVTYGLADDNDLHARNLSPIPDAGYTFDVYLQTEQVASVALQVPGRHNVLNALAALGVGQALGLEFAPMATSLAKFNGSGRRFDVRGVAGGVTIVDDYAHHPTEIRVTIEAARARYPTRPLWVVWQPHTFSRTQLFFDEFAAAFSGADHVVVTDVYAAREKAPDGFAIETLVDAIDGDAQHGGSIEDVTGYLKKVLRANDVLITLSAGDAIKISEHLFENLPA